MQNLDDIWLRGQAARLTVLQLSVYGAALAGTAGLQALQSSATAPQTFWSALARATDPDRAEP